MFVQDSDAPPARNGLKRPNGSSAPRAAFWVITEMDVRGFFFFTHDREVYSDCQNPDSGRGEIQGWGGGGCKDRLGVEVSGRNENIRVDFRCDCIEQDDSIGLLTNQETRAGFHGSSLRFVRRWLPEFKNAVNLASERQQRMTLAVEKTPPAAAGRRAAPRLNSLSLDI